MIKKRALLRFMESELMIVLALVLLLGILFGYSLAAASVHKPGMPSIMDAGVGGEKVK